MGNESIDSLVQGDGLTKEQQEMYNFYLEEKKKEDEKVLWCFSKLLVPHFSDVFEKILKKDSKQSKEYLKEKKTNQTGNILPDYSHYDFSETTGFEPIRKKRNKNGFNCQTRDIKYILREIKRNIEDGDRNTALVLITDIYGLLKLGKRPRIRTRYIKVRKIENEYYQDNLISSKEISELVAVEAPQNNLVYQTKKKILTFLGNLRDNYVTRGRYENAIDTYYVLTKITEKKNKSKSQKIYQELASLINKKPPLPGELIVLEERSHVRHHPHHLMQQKNYVGTGYNKKKSITNGDGHKKLHINVPMILSKTPRKINPRGQY